tara:strand:- start:4177 stop:5193 length:1017 start_codon:yes stop_codon:yes gene_type:complete
VTTNKTKKTSAKKIKKSPVKKVTRSNRIAQKKNMRAMLNVENSGTQSTKKSSSNDTIDRLNDKIAEVEYIPIERLHANPFQPRKSFDDGALEDLSSSIKQHGFFGNLVVRPFPKKRGAFQIAYGERRLRAAKLSGLEAIPCEIKRGLNDQDMLEFALVENAQREDLNPAEEIEAINALKESTGLSHKELAKRLGKSKTWIVERLRIKKYSEILEAVRNGLPWTTGTELARFDDDTRRALMLDYAQKGMLTRSDLLSIHNGTHTLEECLRGKQSSTKTKQSDSDHTPSPPTFHKSILRFSRTFEQLSQTPPPAEEKEEAIASLRTIVKQAEELLQSWGG